MFVPLDKIYAPLHAQSDAGTLRAHGIAAWVTGDVSSPGSDGVVAAGGCRVMVRETDVEEALRILDTLPLALTASVARNHSPQKPLTIGRRILTGALQGAFWLPVVILGFYMVMEIIATLRGSTALNRGEFSIITSGVLRGILSLMLMGTALGILAGIVSWFLYGYRHRSRTGSIFVIGIVLLIAAPELLYILVQWINQAVHEMRP